METAFSDLHRRYEKTKSVVAAMKKVYMLRSHCFVQALNASADIYTVSGKKVNH